ncbi:MAG: aspartate aminotransferase-like enzyme [Planctomycetota bacterium]|jgi:aspartate aminotransferase-like enzyme
MLWIPGPTYVRPQLLDLMAVPPIGHRTAEMESLISRMDAHLKLAFGFDDDGWQVAATSCSATGLMESALIGAGERILCIVGGAFGKRWATIAKDLGKDVSILEVPAGEVVNDMLLAETLDMDGPFDALTLVANETSTGVYTDPFPIARVLQAFPDTLFLADVVSLIAGGPLDVERNCIDFALAGVQKALALPPGIAVCSVSEAFMERAAEQSNRGFYLDPIRIVEGHAKRKTPTTPCIALYRALAQQLEDISNGVNLPEAFKAEAGAAAWQARYDVHLAMQTRTLEWAAGHGLSPFPVKAGLSPTVACIRAGEIDVPKLISGLKEHGHEIGNGYGDLKNQTFRIGHMGDHTPDQLEELLSAADAVLAKA